MSADLGCAYSPAALLLRASRYTACRVFRIEAGGSLHRCADCNGTEAEHVVVALRDQVCATCRHADRDYASEAEFGRAYVPACQCGNRQSWFDGKLMPLTEGCTKWEAR